MSLFRIPMGRIPETSGLNSTTTVMRQLTCKVGALNAQNQHGLRDGRLTPHKCEPDTYLVVGDEGVVGADLLLGPGETLDLGNASSDGDGVRIVDADGTVVDVVVYGPNNDNALENEEGAAVTESGHRNRALAKALRVDQMVYTNVLSSDFDVVSEPTLGGSNGDGPPPPDCDVSEFVVINEIMASPSGADDGNILVELYNPEEEPINTSGWTIASGPSSFSTDGQIPVDTWIDAKGYLVVAQSSNVVDAVIAAGFFFGNGFNSDAKSELRIAMVL